MIELTVPDLIINVLIAPGRLRLSSKDEITEVAAVDTLERLLSTCGIAYAVKGRQCGEETIPFELDFIFNSLYGALELRKVAEVFQTKLVEKNIVVKLIR
jgi:hypothetical protein